MPGALAAAEAAARFRAEYDRLNREVYRGALPPFPGVRLTDAGKVAGACHWRGRTLLPFRLSRHNTDPDAQLDTIRHEVAHAAAYLLDGDRGHGPAWRAHAERCGATPRACSEKRLAKAPKVVLACTACGKEVHFFRATRVVGELERYRCRPCGGAFRVVKDDTPPGAAAERRVVARVRCPTCPWERAYYRRSPVTENVARYRCRACGTTLQRAPA